MDTTKEYIKQFMHESKEFAKKEVVEPPEFTDGLGRIVKEGDLVVRYGTSGSGRPILSVPAKIVGFKKIQYSSTDYRWKVSMKNLNGNSATAMSMENYIILDSRGLQ